MMEMAEGSKAAFDAGLGAALVGGSVGAMEIAYRASLQQHGLLDTCLMRFGVGISAAYPPAWENQIAIQYESSDLLESGMAFYIHACLQSLRDRTGIMLGGSFLVTEAGPERLDNAPLELVILNGSG
jgi:Xaa-Pro aminopeptidase